MNRREAAKLWADVRRLWARRQVLTRQGRYWLWAVTREDRPNRRAEAWADLVHRMVQENPEWAGLRFRAGQLVDRDGKFARPGPHRLGRKDIAA